MQVAHSPLLFPLWVSKEGQKVKGHRKEVKKMDKIEYVHYALPVSFSQIRAEEAIRNLVTKINKKIEEQEIQKEMTKKFLKKILTLKEKFFNNKEKTIAATKIIIGDFLIIQKDGIIIDGKVIEENEESTEIAEIDVEKIVERLEKIDEANIIIV